MAYDENSLYDVLLHLEELQDITERRFLKGKSPLVEGASLSLLRDEEYALQLQAEYMGDLVAGALERGDGTLVDGMDEVDHGLDRVVERVGREATAVLLPGPNRGPYVTDSPLAFSSPESGRPMQEKNRDSVDGLNATTVIHSDAQIVELVNRIDELGLSSASGGINTEMIIQALRDTNDAVCGRLDELARCHNTVIEALNSNLNQQFNENQSLRGEIRELGEMVKSLSVVISESDVSGGYEKDVRVHGMFLQNSCKM
ncbi:hypothetical protein L218DRAFT_701066 [Marasmius fiardii PR-910]|nr:hypothetical protein L218DRAFT_701066 [Marasmius fiardii PR-910]